MSDTSSMLQFVLISGRGGGGRGGGREGGKEGSVDNNNIGRGGGGWLMQKEMVSRF